ncbi:MAG TPA: SpvB/TcaC N-terminal domain-containing protein [Spirillospora sp.]|nr:SpvB/TcaC N-terminal domain-containing protein [Spirillospora sp.]
MEHPHADGPARIERESADSPLIRPPAVALPKGGGAIRGIGEKFAANPVSGTGALTVPIATSPGRSGLGPRLALGYDSGAGNGPFGFGWSLGLPQISRKTDKGLPRYDDAAESDVFLLSGADDLVPVLDSGGSRLEDVTSVPGHTIHRYRPRIEKDFVRIERWTRNGDGDVHWRTVSKDNVLNVYGTDLRSRIADPADPRRIFTWLLRETRDDKGNAVVYEYRSNDGTGVDPGRAHESNRGGPDDPRRMTNRYIKHIRYGNRVPLLDGAGLRPRMLTDEQITGAGWMFEVVFDYGEHDAADPKPGDTGPWTHREDAFSSYRAGFEVRHNRLCRRVLMFHHFEHEDGVGDDCLVRSTDFTFSHEVSPADAQELVYTFLCAVTLNGYRRQGAGYLKRGMPPVEFEYTRPVVQRTVRDVDPSDLENLPIGLDGTSYQWVDLHGEGVPGVFTEQGGAWFYKRNLSPIDARRVRFAPMERADARPDVALSGGRVQFMDLAGDGRTDVVVLDGPAPGLYEHDGDQGWEPFRPFALGLDRDAADPGLRFVDLTGDGLADVLISEDDAFLWHGSLGEQGFGPARRVLQALDENSGPRPVFAGGAESVHLADMSGDGLTDLVRVRDGEVCYWPNLGYGRFGAKVTMDGAPHFDHPDQFDHRRVLLADIDGGGTADIIYLHRDGVRIYFNLSGNGWSAPQVLAGFPQLDDVAAVRPVDLLGNGTVCLVWSSPLPGDARRQMRYVDLMGGQKPHLLVRTVNNLGAETRIDYAPSTRFYLQDKDAGRPWNTRLPFPVHVVERVETVDAVSGSSFVTRYAYHHGHFDGDEREFRGFGMVEQTDTEEPAADDADPAAHCPPVLTKTWFHTGSSPSPGQFADFFAGQDRPPDTVLPPGLPVEEEREACRALKGSMLRQEVYGLDGSDRASVPYSVTEQTFTVRPLQRKGENRHAVFFTHARETVNHHYERDPADPRTDHALTLEVDDFGNVLRAASVAYGRRQPDPNLSEADQQKQTRTLITHTESRVTNAVDTADDYRTPTPCEARTYEVTGFQPPADRARYTPAEMLDVGTTAVPLAYEETPAPGTLQKRLIEQVRTLYRSDDLTGELPLGTVQPRALPAVTCQLAFTPGLVTAVYGERVSDAMLETDGGYVHREGDANWWIPSGQVFYSPERTDTAAQELEHARLHFFLPHRYRDPFQTETSVTYDAYDLLLQETLDALGNRVTVGERTPAGAVDPNAPGNDYRVLQPRLVTDPNGNRTAVAFDALGMVVGTAVMGKPAPAMAEGDSLDGFEADLTEDAIAGHLADPLADPRSLLRRATTRLVYDLFGYQRTRTGPRPQPAVVVTLARETHDGDPVPDGGLRIQQSFAYSDGFAREIQKKTPAEAGPGPRWTGTGWTVFNNKGKPVRQYEPFFTGTHRFESDARTGVSSVLYYDPAGRVVATLHPDHTWEKVVFGPWRQETWGTGDTVLIADPATDPDAGDFFRRMPPADYLPTWLGRREGGELGEAERLAARKAAVHAGTPTVAHADTQGRAFLTVAHNRFQYSGTPADEPPAETFHHWRVVLDVEGNQRELVDARDRVVMRYHYDMLGGRVHQASMDAGERWTLSDVAGKPVYTWDGRGHRLRTAYDLLRRPNATFVSAGAGPEALAGRVVYGEESGPDPEAANLRAKVFQVFDQAGVVTSGPYDFKGNPLQSRRRLAADFTTDPDWSGDVPLDPAVYSTATRRDALNRTTELTTPDDSVVRLRYNEANLLDAVDVNLRGARQDDRPVWTSFVRNIDYDARGQRVLVEFGNGAATGYTYDPLTFRLVNLLTRRDAAAFPDDCPRPPPAGSPGCQVQNIRYTYDAAGNIVHSQDDAQQAVFFRNRRVEPSSEYTYDALSWLIESTGREHVGQAGGVPVPHSYNDALRVALPHPGDGQAMATYRERYVYDLAGNVAEVSHRGGDDAKPGWRRTYTYTEPSPMEPAQRSNRLTSTTVGATTETYSVDGAGYDANGNMLRMPHLQQMEWDFKNQLRMTARQAVDGSDADGAAHQGERTFHVYDADGRRVRKVIESADGSVKDERIYLGGFEIHRRFGADPLVRETLHVQAGEQRIALVETRTQGSDRGPAQVVRYQIGDHLGSAVLELDDTAQIISYEESTPYGSTSYQAVRGQTEAPKRYRFTGKERDEESGLYYHGARYYAPWLARWVSCDPILSREYAHPYAYVNNSPTQLMDPNGAEDKEPTATGPFRRLPNSGDLGSVVHRAVLDVLRLRLAVLGASSLVETETLPGGSKNMKTDETGHVDLAVMLPDRATPGAYEAHLYEVKPNNPEKYEKYISEVDHYTDYFPHEVAGMSISHASIGIAVEAATKIDPRVLAPMVFVNESLEVTIRLDLARGNNNRPKKGLLVYDVDVRSRRPGEDDSVAAVKALLRTSINQTAEAQAHGIVRASVMVGGTINAANALAQLFLLGGGVALGGAAAGAGAGGAGAGGAAAGGGAAGGGAAGGAAAGAGTTATAATTGIRIATGVRIAERVGETVRVRVATEVAEELAEESAEILKRMSVRR